MMSQKHLNEVTDAINSRLEYFKELEVATKALSQPGDSVVLQDDFLNMVERLDICLDFLRNNVGRYYSGKNAHVLSHLPLLYRGITAMRKCILSDSNNVRPAR